jgi:hypothetical protein
MQRPTSFSATKHAFWTRLPTTLLIYWFLCFLFFRIVGAYDFTHFWPHYFSAKNGSSFFSITGLTTLIAFLLFGIATVVASMQMLDKDENDFRKQSKRLAILMVITAAILPLLGQIMVKANKAKEIEGILQLASELEVKTPELTRLRIHYYTDFSGKSGEQAEKIIEAARAVLVKKIKEHEIDGQFKDVQ